MMSTSRANSLIPDTILFNLGGYTGFKTREWQRYLDAQIRKHHPEYYAHGHDEQSQRWQQNDCIYESLKKYLLFEFGILLPEDTIFKVFNPDGEGLLPADILTAISAVIEPLGLVLDHVIVVEPRLRAALGCPEVMVDLDETALFENRAGICMINIEGGYSHAFFWDRMRTSKFSSAPFRLALTIRRARPQNVQPAFSVLAGLRSFEQLAASCATHRPSDAALTQVNRQARDLVDYACCPKSQQSADFRAVIDQKWETLLAMIQSCLSENHSHEKLRQLLDTAAALRILFKEAIVIS